MLFKVIMAILEVIDIASCPAMLDTLVPIQTLRLSVIRLGQFLNARPQRNSRCYWCCWLEASGQCWI